MGRWRWYEIPEAKSEVRSPKSEVRIRRDYGGVPRGFGIGELGDEPVGEFVLHDKSPPGNQSRDLEERAAQFGEAIVRFAKKVPRNAVNNRLIDQLVGAGTSVGANYSEAKDAVSRKDFKNA